MSLYGSQIMLREEDWENDIPPLYTVRNYIIYETMAVQIEENYRGYGGQDKTPATMRLYVDCTNGVATADVEAYEKSLGLEPVRW